MRSGVKVGRLFGIDFYIDWSWLFIFFLITWQLAASFGQFHSGWSDGLRWGVAVVAALLFFGSVLAHELAHSLMAMAHGVNVRNITLHLFGGVSNIERNPPSPRAEFLITIVGPLTSFVLGVLFLLIGGVSVGTLGGSIRNPLRMMQTLGPVTTTLLWLGGINIILGIFNLIPGFPLDGGRVLRSVLWAASDNLRRATRWASWIGQGVAWLLILTGIAMIFGANVPFFGSGFGSGLWLAFIGWFLNSASIQSYRQIVIQDVLEGVQVEQLMRRNAPTVSPNITISTLVHEYVMGTDDHAFPVVEGGRLVGMVTLEDMRSVPRERWNETNVAKVMTPAEDLVKTTPDADAADALSRLSGRDVRQLPVVRNGNLLGVLRRSDIVRWLQLQSKEVA
jgi:Zn-dependent protease/predicted transcriptional regulator